VSNLYSPFTGPFNSRLSYSVRLSTTPIHFPEKYFDSLSNICYIIGLGEMCEDDYQLLELGGNVFDALYACIEK